MRAEEKRIDTRNIADLGFPVLDFLCTEKCTRATGGLIPPEYKHVKT